MINYYNSEKNRCIEIEHYFKALFKDRKTEKRISDSIISENEIADEASPNLAAIRRRIESTHIKIREHLNSVIHSTKYQNTCKSR